VKHTSVVTTVTPEITRHSPRNGFTAYFVLSSATNSSCHRHPRIKVLSARSGRLTSANLTPATGARTTRLHRTRKAPIILHAAYRSRGSSRPAIAICAPDALASTASRPALVTTRDRPSGGTRRFGYASDLGEPKTKIFFAEGLDRILLICPSGQLAAAQMPGFDLPWAANQQAYPVRCGVSIPSQPSLEYWIARSSRAMTVEGTACSPPSPREGPGRGRDDRSRRALNLSASRFN
jgi:hypothetical protein